MGVFIKLSTTNRWTFPIQIIGVHGRSQMIKSGGSDVHCCDSCQQLQLLHRIDLFDSYFAAIRNEVASVAKKNFAT